MGSSANCPLTWGVSTNLPGTFSQRSFSVSVANLSGGRNAGTAPGTIYNYSVAYAANGDVLSGNDTVNGNWTYAYDAFNRLLTAASSNTGLGCSWVYDRFGNRLQQNPYNGSCGAPQYTSSGGNNRMDGYSYDAAGNLTTDSNNNTYTYDAENRISQVGPAGSTATYVYDAAGQRVRKTSSAGTVDYIYDLAGHEIAEVSSARALNRGEVYAGGRHLATYDGGTTYFNHVDWLGTERARSSLAAMLCETITSFPFGDGQATNGFCGDPSPMHFTGKQRDAETGLDYFDARYYGSSMGRFTSPDPLFISPERLMDPQSLTLYSYVRNNPLGLTDDSGLDFYLACQTSDHSGCGQVQNGSNKVWVQGQGSGKDFVATDVDMNKQGDTSAGYRDQFGNQYTGTFDQNNGVSFTNTSTGATSGRSQFIDGSDPTQLSGSGAFTNITGNFFSDCGRSCEGRAALSGTADAFAATESQLNKASSAEALFDRLFTGAHKSGSQWHDDNGYVRMLENSGKMELHFQRHPTGVDLVNLVLHAVDAIRDRSSGRAAAERDTPLP
jgi:RHS repeat-associated protein